MTPFAGLGIGRDLLIADWRDDGDEHDCEKIAIDRVLVRV